MEQITVTQAAMDTFDGSDVVKKGAALLEAVGPHGEHDLWQADGKTGLTILDATFTGLAEQFETDAEGTAEDESLLRGRLTATLSNMIDHLRTKGYEVVFQAK